MKGLFQCRDITSCGPSTCQYQSYIQNLHTIRDNIFLLTVHPPQVYSSHVVTAFQLTTIFHCSLDNPFCKISSFIFSIFSQSTLPCFLLPLSCLLSYAFTPFPFTLPSSLPLYPFPFSHALLFAVFLLPFLPPFKFFLVPFLSFLSASSLPQFSSLQFKLKPLSPDNTATTWVPSQEMIIFSFSKKAVLKFCHFAEIPNYHSCLLYSFQISF